MSSLRPRHLLAATILVTSGLLAPAPAKSSDSPYVPVTAAERSQTRPLVTIVLTAHRSGDFSSLCAFLPERDIRASGGTRARCRTLARSNLRPPCGRCTFRIAKVVGVYPTESARAARRKTVVWLVAVKGTPQFNELEFAFVREQGRWVLSKLLHVSG